MAISILDKIIDNFKNKFELNILDQIVIYLNNFWKDLNTVAPMSVPLLLIHDRCSFTTTLSVVRTITKCKYRNNWKKIQLLCVIIKYLYDKFDFF